MNLGNQVKKASGEKTDYDQKTLDQGSANSNADDGNKSYSQREEKPYK